MAEHAHITPDGTPRAVIRRPRPARADARLIEMVRRFHRNRAAIEVLHRRMDHQPLASPAFIEADLEIARLVRDC